MNGRARRLSEQVIMPRRNSQPPPATGLKGTSSAAEEAGGDAMAVPGRSRASTYQWALGRDHAVIEASEPP